MTRLMQASLALLIAGLVCLLTVSSPLVTTATAQGQNNPKKQADESTRDAPPDTTPYRRPALPEDYAPRGIRAIPLVPSIFIVDTVVNNTDPNLTNTDTFNDGETSITVNPANPNEIVVTAFSGSWGAHAPPVAFDGRRKYLDQAIYNPCAARHSGNRLSLRSNHRLRNGQSNVRYLSHQRHL